jgi:hypothetical protein
MSNKDIIDYREDYYNGAAGIYFRKILNTIIKFGNLKNEKGLVLDYGCGVSHLKKNLTGINVVGYDILPELSDVNDYRNLKPDKIVLSGVLEHIYLDDQEKLLKEFKQMNPRAELLVYLPTENFISKIAMHLAGQKYAHNDHVTKYKEINNLLSKYYKLKQRKYIFIRMAQVSHYVPK